MSLSDREIEELLRNIDSLEKSGEPGSSKKILEYYDRIIENAPSHPIYFSERAYIKHRLSMLDSAIEDLDKAIELDQDNARYYDRRGEYLLQKLEGISGIRLKKHQLIDKVISDFKTALEKDPCLESTWLNSMYINILLHNWDECISLYGQCKPYMDKENQLVRAWLGCLALIFAGDPLEEEDKEILYDKVIPNREHNMIKAIGEFLKKFACKEGNDEKYEKAIGIHKLFIIGRMKWLWEYCYLKDLGCYKEALECCNRALDMNPNDAQAVECKIVMLEELQHYADLLKFCNQRIEIESSRFAIDKLLEKKAYILAFRMNNMEQNEQGVQIYEELTKRHPSSRQLAIYYCKSKGDFFTKSGSYEEAIKHLDKIAEMNEGLFEYAIVWEKCKLLFKLNRSNEALEILDEMSKKVSYDEYNWLRRGEVFMDANLYDDALKAYEEVIRLSPKNAKAWDNKGVVFKRLGRYEEAFVAFEKAIELNPNLAEAWYNKACTFAVKGDKMDSLKNLLKAIELNLGIKEIAKKDKDFQYFWADEEFKKIVE